MKLNLSFLVLLLIAICSLTYRLGAIELRAEEPRRAIVSIEMMESGDYLKPRLGDYPYYNKPPLYNWIQVAFYKTTGSTNEFISRLPGIVSLLLTALLLYFLIRKRDGEQTAIISSFMLLTFADLLFYGTVNSGEIDLFYILISFGQLVLLFKSHTQNSFSSLSLSYIILALAFLTKGLPAYFFQFTGVLALLLIERNLSFRFLFRQAIGFLISVGILLGYYAWLEHETGEALCYLQRQFTEAGQRTGMAFEIKEILANALLFPFNLIKLLLPWSLLPLLMIFKKFRKIPRDKMLRFSLYFVLLSLPLFWLSGEIRNRYLYPIFPFIAYFLARYFKENFSDKNQKWSGIVVYAIHILCILIAISCIIIWPTLENVLTCLAVIFCILLFVNLGLRNKSPLVLWTFLSLFALKFLFSQSAQPKLLEKEFSYKNQLDTLMAMSNGNPWNLEISADQLISDGPFDSCRLSITPIIPYQYHYYHYLYTGKILKRDHSRTYRFMRSEPKLLDSYTRVFQFEDKMNNKFMLLAN